MTENTPSSPGSGNDSAVEQRVDAMMDDTARTPEPFADEATEKLVDDIVVREGDELLGRSRNDVVVVGPRKPALLRRILSGWLHNKWAITATAFLFVTGLAALAAVPTSRYYALNTAGVRSGATLSIVDQSTLQPLKNVSVEVGEHRAKTNEDGLVKLSGLPLGTQSLTISQRGFATVSRTVTLGWGSNPLGDFSLQPVGKQFRFRLVDFLTGKPVTDAEISRGDSNAQADNKGAMVLTIAQDDTDDGLAKITAKGYRIENVSLEEGQKQSRSIVMVPAQKAVFVSKQSGKYDLYKMDLDGKNKQVLLAASGYEDADISVVPNVSGSQVALVSRRDQTKNQDGFPLQTLTIINVVRGSVLTLDRSEQIRIIDWSTDKIVYVKIKAGTSAGNPERYQLVSYDPDSFARNQLASANYFNDIVAVRGALYYAASNNFQGGSSQFATIMPDNSGKKVLLDKTDIWNIARTGYDTLTLTSLSGTYEYKVGDAVAQKVSTSTQYPSETRFYLDASGGDRSLWSDYRDGKGVLLHYDAKTGKETTITAQTGLNYPLRWLNDRTAIYRIASPVETADYAVSLDGGAPKKLTDLTNTIGLGSWQRR